MDPEPSLNHALVPSPLASNPSAAASSSTPKRTPRTSQRKSLIWEQFVHVLSPPSGSGGGIAKPLHAYKCVHCTDTLRRSGKEIDVPSLVVHLIACASCPEHVRLAVCRSSKSAKAAAYLAKASTAARSRGEVVLDGGGGVGGGEKPAFLHLDAVTPLEREEMDVLLAMMVVGEGAHRLTESPLFGAFVRMVRPAYAGDGMLPGKERIAGELLGKVCERVEAMVRAKERGSVGLVSLAFHGGSVVEHRPCLSVLMNVVEGVDLFQGCESVGEAGAEVAVRVIAEAMIAKIEGVGVDKVCSLSSDSTPAVAKARRIVCQKYPGVLDAGDGVHCVDLMFDDFVADVPEFEVTIANCETLISYIVSNPAVALMYKSIVTSALANAAAGAGAAQPAVDLVYLPGTRFKVVHDMVNQILSSRSVLEAMVSVQHMDVWDTAVKNVDPDKTRVWYDLVRNPATWVHFTTVSAYAAPLARLTAALDIPSVRFSDILPLAVDTLRCIEAVQPHAMAEASRQAVATLARTRLFGDRNSRGLVVLVRNEESAALALDPIFRPIDLVPLLSPTVFVIDSFFRDHDVKRLLARDQLNDYALRAGGFSAEATSTMMWEESVVNEKLTAEEAVAKRGLTPRTAVVGWWKLFGGSAPELQELAIALASTSVQAVSTQRSFSMQDLLHDSQRSQLQTETVRKLLFCYFNLRSLHSLPGLPRRIDPIDDMTLEFLTATAENTQNS